MSPMDLAALATAMPLPLATAAAIETFIGPSIRRKPRRPVSAASIRLQWHGGRTTGVAR
jgi:hypothetical protein